MRGTLYLQKLALTSPTSGSLLVGIVRWHTESTEFPPPQISHKTTRQEANGLRMVVPKENNVRSDHKTTLLTW
jgi:hypothetical protein